MSNQEENHAAYLKRQAKLDRKSKRYFVTNKEHEILKKRLKELRR